MPKTLVRKSAKFFTLTRFHGLSLGRVFRAALAHEMARNLRNIRNLTENYLSRMFRVFSGGSIESCVWYTYRHKHTHTAISIILTHVFFQGTDISPLPTDFARFGLDSSRYKSLPVRIQRAEAPIVFNKNRFVRCSVKKWEYVPFILECNIDCTLERRLWIFSAFIESGTNLNWVTFGHLYIFGGTNSRYTLRLPKNFMSHYYCWLVIRRQWHIEKKHYWLCLSKERKMQKELKYKL